MSAEVNLNIDLPKFEKWLDSKLKEYYNPIANIITATEHSKFNERKHKEPDKRSFNNYTDTKSNKDGISKSPNCWLCSNSHKIWKCELFKAKSVAERKTCVKDLKLCFNCLSKNHQIKDCQSKITCKECNKKHHSLLHIEKLPDGHEAQVEATSSSVSHVKSQNKSKRTPTYLQVLPVTISNGENSIKTNALLDCGSDTTLVSKNLADKLNLKGKSLNLNITNVLTSSSHLKSKSVTFFIHSVFNL